MAPMFADDAVAETEQILYADEGEAFAESRVGRKQMKAEIKAQQKREKEAAKLYSILNTFLLLRKARNWHRMMTTEPS